MYLAFGYRFLVMASNSARSARKAGTQCHIKLITNLALKRIELDGEKLFDEIIVVSARNRENRYSKIRILDFADGPVSLYLDCDTEVKFPLHRFVPIMTKFDVALRPMLNTQNDFAAVDTHSSLEIGLTNLNAGIMFIAKSSGTRKLFDLWAEYFPEMSFRNDQPSFQKAVIDSGARVYPLGIAWNVTPLPELDLGFIARWPEGVRILHYRDPVFWPAVGPALAYVHRHAVLEFAESSSERDVEIETFGMVVRHYEQLLFRYRWGRRLIDWRLQRLAARNGAGPARLHMKGEREIPRKDANVSP
ncbi:MAG TPA: hypothetical protein VD840_15135 [Sinorhizobium sp.]|nr:hypothetical protein [Sinorhizobium sp.]